MDTVELAHDVTGSGPLLVLLHGITGDRHAWDPLVPSLAGRFRVVTLDLRGHGESPSAPTYGLVDYAADVAEVVERIGGSEAPLLVGHSLGGAIATVYAASYPTRGVINIDQALDLRPLQAAVTLVGPFLRGTGPAPAPGSLPDADLAWVADLPAAQRVVVAGTWSLMLDTTRQQLATAVDDLLDGVCVPYLAIHGSEPEQRYAEWLAERIPGAEVEVWPGAGHGLHLEQSDRFLRRVTDFAEQHPAVAADTI